MEEETYITDPVTCCICYEEEDKLGCITCDRCKEGIICLDCTEKIDDNEFPIFFCPVCRSIMISYTLYNIVFWEFDEVRYKKPSENSSLIQRWVENGTPHGWSD